MGSGDDSQSRPAAPASAAAPGAIALGAVLMAMAGNGFVALIKFVAFFLSGSGAMLSEAIHSFADTANQLLLYVGLRRSQRRHDEEFPYGYGGERFVFGLLSASGIFFVGCGVTVYHGVESILHPTLPRIDAITFAVLGVSTIIEGSVFIYALRGMLRQRGTLPFMFYLRERADPAALAILLEDGVAVLGLALAAMGIVASYVTGQPLWDSLASIAVGVMLGVVAVILVIENREALLGRAVPEDVEARFEALLGRWPTVRSVHDVKSRQITPDTYLLKAEVAFDEKLLTARLDAVLARHEGGDREAMLRALAECALQSVGAEIDAIEVAVRAAIPEARHIDLEVHRVGGAVLGSFIGPRRT